LVENGIPPSPFIRQSLKRAPIEGEERVEVSDVISREEVLVGLGKQWRGEKAQGENQKKL
jgi:hypothetical protein